MPRSRPLTCKEVKKILKNLGFEKKKTKNATSHEKWSKTTSVTRYNVTVDCPKQPFSHDLIASMARQAGVSKKKFYDSL